ncbi:hypothetical protein DCAR_0414604 [Daucus carota subsp. sativus]|uniref:Uncharacterized protein n=1 Tax=Daucus carota subsp. sativus TaxID=79200 RepID=A0A175YBV1_DAUCS|nr:hypothetical protein DCAR_0414604 [Daucus carota subsp. sativus]
MGSHYGFSDSDDEFANTAIYECSDSDHCDKGDSCDGEHGYSHHYIEEWVVQSDVTMDENPQTLPNESAIQVPFDENNSPPVPLSSDPVELATVVAPDPDPSSDDLDLDVEADSEDACSRS